RAALSLAAARSRGPGLRSVLAAYPGGDGHAPSTARRTVAVLAGSPPAPSVVDDLVGEAGYPVRLVVTPNDPDGDATTVAVDLTGDGTDDVVRPVTGPGPVAIDLTYGSAFTGSARVRVVDATGQSGTVEVAAAIAPHRPLGALRRLVLSGGGSLHGLAATAAGRHVLVQAVDEGTGQPPPQPPPLLD